MSCGVNQAESTYIEELKGATARDTEGRKAYLERTGKEERKLTFHPSSALKVSQSWQGP